MIRYQCDKCGRKLAANDAERYIVKMEIYAAAGPLEFEAGDLERDRADELGRLLDQLESADPDAVEDQTYRCLRFDICRACQQQVLNNPLGAGE
ncbi:MAG: hypothetical protein GY778_14220 [bacterium]|nr:hypothetical protein [bacterium]